MNIFKKIFCRVYQLAFHAALPLLPYREPKILQSVQEIAGEMDKNNLSSALIITDAFLKESDGIRTLTKSLSDKKIEYGIYGKTRPNPTVCNVEEALKLYHEKKCDCLIAFGGGSPMDCCKGIGAVLVKNKPVDKLQGLFRVLHRIPTIFAVPTTAGTGSETTVAAVITDSKTHHKASMNDTSLMPKFAVLDPQLTTGLPPHVTSTTGMDALCHAVESYTNNTYNSKLEKKLAEDAVRLIYHNLYQAYCDGENIEARQNMQKAAFYAGRAFTRGCVGYVHALGHTLGGLYGTPHGLAMSVILPHVMRQFGPAAHERLARLAEVCGMTGKNDAEKAEAFLTWIEQLKAKMNIPEHLDVIKGEDIPQIIKWASKEANPLYPVPVIWGKEDFEKCIASIRG